MDIEFQDKKQNKATHKSSNGLSTDKQSLWFEEPSESIQKLSEYYRQCNTLEFGQKPEIKEILKVSIDSSFP